MAGLFAAYEGILVLFLLKIYFGIGVLIGIILSLFNHNGALLLGLGFTVFGILAIELWRIKGRIRFSDYCRFRIWYILAAVFLTGFSLVTPFLPIFVI